MSDQNTSLELDGVPDMTNEEADQLFGPPSQEPPKEVPKYADDGTLLFPEDEDEDTNNPDPEPPAEPPAEPNPGDPDDKTKDTDPPAKDYKPGAILEGIKEEYGLEIAEIPEGFTAQQEAQVLSEVLERQKSTFKEQIVNLQNYDTLVSKDPEVQQFLQMKANGKNFKEIISELGGQAAYLGDDVHVASFLKENYGFNDNQIQEEINKMKDAGVYEDRKKVIVDAAVKKEEQDRQYQAQQEQAQIQAQQDAYDKQVNAYNEYLGKTDQIGDFKLSNAMKKDLHGFATNLDEEGYTPLERAVQSNENALKASLAIKYWEDFVKVVSSGASERTKRTILEQLETDPSQLQSSSHKKKDTDQVSTDLANSF